MNRNLVSISRLSKAYPKKNQTVTVLKEVDLALSMGRFLAIMGPSGSGKSTLLNIIGCLDRPSGGTYRLDGVDVLTASDERLSWLRSYCLGFVFQNFNLIPNLTVQENVELPFLYRKGEPHEIRQRVDAAIDEVELTHRRNHRPAELSGGEMQRTAIARALAGAPKLILADEPTGNLDSRTSQEIMGLFNRLNRMGSTIILVTHDSQVARHAHDRVTLCDGQIVT